MPTDAADAPLPLTIRELIGDCTFQDALAHSQTMAQQIADLINPLASAGEALRPFLSNLADTAQILEPYTHSHVFQAPDEILRVDTLFLDDLLRNAEPWQRLPTETRGEFSDILQEAFHRADATALEDALVLDGPEAMELEEQARLLNEQAVGMPWAARRSIFLWFVTSCASLHLFTATLESETAQNTVGSAADVLSIAVILFSALGLLWDRVSPRSDNED
ncbi:hypothetical protein ACFTZ8_26665 [Streptomyces fungicidicus]|uniref:hypothetical protein n=1 Tax=Streptomyces fungicidicus TaxID=68203 RepID=UPI00363B30C6